MTMKKTCIALLVLSASGTVAANSLDTARSIESKTNAASAVSQDRIDKSADSALNMKAEIERLEEETKNLAIYHDHLARLVENQQQEMVHINQQINDIKETRQGIVPLMYQMLDGLDQVIKQDKPIKEEQRVARLHKLQAMMDQADISDAEKFRRLLEAYQIEMDYGTKLATYQAKITLSDNKIIEANILHLGRLVLVARSLDGQQYWSWNAKNKSWQSVDGDQADNIAQAYAMANKDITPNLLTLPISPSHLSLTQAAGATQ
ncbi:DUF3450 domain-containing protein [Photobacterium damselae]|uniref:DUF3450 domain-containing protein n=1 Tax=Photobacterium damselae TaxID=38293 RepID=UPI004067897F